MKHYSTDYIRVGNETAGSSVNLDFNGLKLAKSIWYVELCRRLQMPNRLQARIIRCCGGSTGLWSNDIHKIIDRIKNRPNCREDCLYQNKCQELHNKETKFLAGRLNDLYSAWSDNTFRSEVLQKTEKYQDRNIYSIDITDSLYPANLLNISGYPAILFCEGDGLSDVNRSPLRITIVGTREPTPYGMKATEMITKVLADYDCAIISGLAKGVDALAHKITLDRGGLTAAVTAGSTDIYYPYQNKQLQQEIAAKGVIISEHPPGTKPIKYFFPARNRLLSGIADVVIVTESPEHSGTLITTSFASDQSREVYAVPGNIIQATSRGCNRLIVDGAALLDEPGQIIERYSLQPRNGVSHLPVISRSLHRNKAITVNNLSEQERIILACLSSHAMSIDQLLSSVKIPIEQLSSLISGLELKNQIGRKKGQYFLTYE